MVAPMAANDTTLYVALMAKGQAAPFEEVVDAQCRRDPGHPCSQPRYRAKAGTAVADERGQHHSHDHGKQEGPHKNPDRAMLQLFVRHPGFALPHLGEEYGIPEPAHHGSTA